MVKTQVWWPTMGFLRGRRGYDFGDGPRSQSVMLVMLAVLWSVSLGRMKTGCTGLVWARQLVLATKTGWDGILVKRIPCCARMVVNVGGEFVLREGVPLRLLK